MNPGSNKGAMGAGTEALNSAVVATVGGNRVSLIEGLESGWFGARIVGRAFTVRGEAGDNLALHRALAEASPGDVIVAELEGRGEGGHWGDLMTISAQARGIAGVILAGTIRDRAEIAARRFPVFHRRTCPRPATKRAPGTLAVPIRIGGADVRPGDTIVADDDGIVVVPAGELPRVLADVAALAEREEAIADRLARGETTIEVLGLGTDSPRGSGQDKKEGNPMSPFFTEADFGPTIEIAPGVRTRTLTRGQLMFSLVEIDDGCSSPIHHHPEVQMGMVLEGAFERHQGGEVRVLRKGEGFYVPPNVEHGGRAVGGPCRVLDVFNPPRAKYVKAEQGQ